MADPAIGLVTGNGFTINFCSQAGILGDTNPSVPFAWEFNAPGPNDRPWQETFPFLHQMFQQHGTGPGFDSFDHIFRAAKAFHRYDQLLLKCEARHFLAFAYSYFQEKLDRKLETLDFWCWYQWMLKHFAYIRVCASLNYDNLLECCVTKIRHDVPGSVEWSDDLPIPKPHGSIDYEIDPAIVWWPKLTYPLQAPVDHNDFGDANGRPLPLIHLHPTQCRAPRHQVTVVIPMEANEYLHLGWVKDAFTKWTLRARGLTHCVFVGVSYAECDRVEIDFLLEKLDKRCVVISANPMPSCAFDSAVQSRGLQHLTWAGDPQPLIDPTTIT